MFEFFRIQYEMGRVTCTQLHRAVALGRITQDDYSQIVGGGIE